MRSRRLEFGGQRGLETYLIEQAKLYAHMIENAFDLPPASIYSGDLFNSVSCGKVDWTETGPVSQFVSTPFKRIVFRVGATDIHVWEKA